MTIDIPLEVLRPLLFFALLFGPTTLWLLYRATRSPTGIAPGSMSASELGSGWVCKVCNSLNLARTERCYRGCSRRPTPAAPLVPAAEAQPLVAVGPGRPLERRRQGPITLAVPAGVGAAAMVRPELANQLPSRPPADGSVVLGGAASVSNGDSTLRPGSSERPLRPGVPVMELLPVQQTPEGRGAGDFLAPVPDACPLLGLRRDARTHFVFPDPEHRCYATVAPGKVDVRHQETYCLRAHRDCMRFRAHRDVSTAP